MAAQGPPFFRFAVPPLLGGICFASCLVNLFMEFVPGSTNPLASFHASVPTYGMPGVRDDVPPFSAPVFLTDTLLDNRAARSPRLPGDFNLIRSTLRDRRRPSKIRKISLQVDRLEV